MTDREFLKGMWDKTEALAAAEAELAATRARSRAYARRLAGQRVMVVCVLAGALLGVLLATEQLGNMSVLLPLLFGGLFAGYLLDADLYRNEPATEKGLSSYGST